MATNIRTITSQDLTTGLATGLSIVTGSISLDSTYFLDCYSTGSLVYLAPSISDTESGMPIFSGSSVQVGPFYPINFPKVITTAAGCTLYVTITQVVSEGR